jgi:hypothetical protein
MLIKESVLELSRFREYNGREDQHHARVLVFEKINYKK